MRITVFGATGGTGRHVVEQALDAGHHVTAVVRDPARLGLPAADRLDVVTVQLDDRAAVRAAVAGADAVVDALGSGSGPTTVRTDAARVIVAAMRDAGVRRLVVVSAAGAHTTGDTAFVRFVVKPVLGYVLRHPFADMRAMEEVVRASDLDWTIVLPPQLTDGPRTGAVRRRVGANVRGSYRLARADLAAAVLDAVGDDGVRHASLSVAAG
ncbi:NAD(P)-dependent oxidoreductase [Pseudonocardia kunmingensis]|uniref:Putative NADH-flavin reductase n=1 Tax=Pseudonocardia kunmingensis TaxID=630975 RepID=A0A543DXB0_9PSEU|nr:NAD(P)H-binding protein [Pseudonocardia kunmingensis]TQM13965.1 putative NADH-flavin reductase [Pseudonocardia kunmingensis]